MAEAYRLKGEFLLEDLLNMAFWRAAANADSLAEVEYGRQLFNNH